jgi:hypothetical protein
MTMGIQKGWSRKGADDFLGQQFQGFIFLEQAEKIHGAQDG